MWRVLLGAWLAFTLVQTPPQIRGFYRIEEPSVAFGDVVQTKGGNASAATITLTFTSTATSGNLLVVGVVASSANPVPPFSAWSDPSGWTALTDSGTSGNMGAKWYYKISDGTETGVTVGATNAFTYRAAFAEYEGPFAASPLDVTAEDETNLATVVTSQASGTTGSTAQASALAVAFFGADAQSTVDGGGTRSYSNSFTETIFAEEGTTTGRPSAALARKVLSATGTQSTTFSVTDTGDEMYGAIAVFKASGGAGGAATVKASTLTLLGVQ